MDRSAAGLLVKANGLQPAQQLANVAPHTAGHAQLAAWGARAGGHDSIGATRCQTFVGGSRTFVKGHDKPLTPAGRATRARRDCRPPRYLKFNPG